MTVPLPGRRELSDDDRRQRTNALLLIAATTEDPEDAEHARAEVVELNVRIAIAVARRYARRGVDLEDLEQTACEALIKAVARYDLDQERDLLTYAVPTIRGELQRYFRDKSWTIRPRRQIQEVQGRLNRFIDDHTVKHDREPTEAEICLELGITPGLYAEAVNAFGCFHPTSINRRVGQPGGSSELGDLLPDPQDELPPVEAQVVLRPLIRRLSERDRRIIYLRFYEDQSQRQIGERFGIKQAQVSRVLDRIYEDLRAQVADDDVPAEPQPAQ